MTKLILPTSGMAGQPYKGIREKLLPLMAQLDAGVVRHIFYGRTGVPLEYQRVYCISREPGLGAPHYLMRGILYNVIVEGTKYPLDGIGRGDTISEFVKWSALMQQKSQRQAQMMGLDVASLIFDCFTSDQALDSQEL